MKYHFITSGPDAVLFRRFLVKVERDEGVEYVWQPDEQDGGEEGAALGEFGCELADEDVGKTESDTYADVQARTLREESETPMTVSTKVAIG